MAKMIYNACGKCKLIKHYPLIKVPLGPPVFEETPDSKAAGLDHKNGYTQYSSFCLECARSYLAMVTESYLKDGTIESSEKETKE